MRFYTKHDPRHYDRRLYFGGSSKSESSNTSSQVYNDSRQAIQNDSHAVSGSYNTSLSATDSHNVTDSSTNNISSSTSYSQATSNSGNTTINYTGTDGGAGHIAELQAQYMHAAGEQNIDAVLALAKMGTSIGGNAAELAIQSQQNSKAVSEHMLDITGDLIGKLSSGAATGAAASALLASAGANVNATTQSAKQDQTMRWAMIGGGLLLALAVLKK